MIKHPFRQQHRLLTAVSAGKHVMRTLTRGTLRPERLSILWGPPHHFRTVLFCDGDSGGS